VTRPRDPAPEARPFYPNRDLDTTWPPGGTPIAGRVERPRFGDERRS